MSFNTIILPTQSSSSSSRTLTTSAAPSYSLTPACSFFHDNHCEGQDEEDQICSLLTMMRGCYGQVEDLEPPAGHLTSNSTVSPTSKNTLTRVPRPVSPDPIKYAKDDTAVQTQPSRHVDYFSHNWKEEDIWSSWKLIVSKRKAYNNCARLENVSWRTWIKLKNKLKTVPPETLDWSVATLSRQPTGLAVFFGLLCFAYTMQAQGLRCDLALWPSTNWIRQDNASSFYFPSEP